MSTKNTNAARKLFDYIHKNIKPNIAPEDVVPHAPISEYLEDIRLENLAPNFTSIIERGVFSPNEAVIQDIFQRDHIGISVWWIGRGSTMPMHDHVGMQVYEKLLMGEFEVEFLDGTTELVKTGEISRITPTINHHGIRTLSNCIFLNITYPNYSSERQCTYFLKGEDGKLVTREAPTEDEWSCVAMEYIGEPFLPPGTSDE